MHKSGWQQFLLLPFKKRNLSCSCCSNQTQTLREPWCCCTAAGVGQVLMAVSCKLTDTALNMCKCTTTGAKGALQVKIRRLSVSSSTSMAAEHIGLISCSAHGFRCHHSLWQLAKQPGRQVVGIISGVNMGALY